MFSAVAGAAHAEKIRKGRQDQKGRHTEGDGRDLLVAAGETDEEGICHVVDHQNDLPCHGGQGQTQDRLPDGQGLKQGFSVQTLLFQGGSSFLLEGAGPCNFLARMICCLQDKCKSYYF